MDHLPDNPITPTVDFEREGAQHGHLALPQSTDLSAWGSIMIPVAVFRNGDGPTALLTGANHGDEYEGPIALLDLAQSLDPAELSGRVIIVPMMNYPAFRAGRRNSPLDEGNLNRAFPGDPMGSATAQIADYFQRTLLPMADYVLDIHAGGRSLDFLPFAAAHELPDPVLSEKCRAAMQAFNAPNGVMMLDPGVVGLYDTAAEEQGKVFVTTELGGGAHASAVTAAIAKKGVRNLLIHAGILAGEPETAPARQLDMPDGRCFMRAESRGLLEYCVDLGASVTAGMELARIHDVEHIGRAPLVQRAAMDGLLLGRRALGLTEVGDMIAVLATEVPGGGAG